MIDVDGSYLVREHEQLRQAGVNVAPLGPPSVPLSSWITINGSNYKDESSKIPRVLPGIPPPLSLSRFFFLSFSVTLFLCHTHSLSLSFSLSLLHQVSLAVMHVTSMVFPLGVLYTYLAEGVGRSKEAEGAFRALSFGVHTLDFWSP